MQKRILILLVIAVMSGCASHVKRERNISQVEVDGVLWERVKSFDNSSPNDRIYTVRKDEDGTSVITFGDGEHGARLPAGTRQVRVRYSSVYQQQGRVQTDDCK